MDIEKLIQEMTLEEKAAMLTGASNMSTAANEKYGIASRRMADGTQGVRIDAEDKENCTMFPAVCSIGATWNPEAAEKAGRALAADCIEHGVDVILGPGANLKRTPLCGRNYEYVSEDPVLSGEMTAGYIQGIQHSGVGACVKHYAMNNQELNRLETSVEVEERVMRELYLKSFEIAIKKGKPQEVMCAYNKIHSVWCSENSFLLTDVLRDEWNYEGVMVSDWGAVHDLPHALRAGLDLQMPCNHHILEDIRRGLEEGTITPQQIDQALTRVLRFAALPKPQAEAPYDRDRQHEIARQTAAEGIVLLKNERNVLPLTAKKYKKIGVVGEYAVKPLTCGQGSAEVYPAPEYIDRPLDELKKLLGDDVEITYQEIFSGRELKTSMIWPDSVKWMEFAEQQDAVVVFAGSMDSEDTEQYDRISISMNPSFDFVIEKLCCVNPNVIVVLQSGSALALGRWQKQAGAILEMWLAGEAGGGAIADVLTGVVNPSGKLSETFPTKLRTDLEYPGNEKTICYREGFEVGYRYYDRHPEEIAYPFGHGLSYSEFAYGPLAAELVEDQVRLRFTLENRSDVDGSEAAQIYVSMPDSIVTRPVKELKAFRKVFVQKHGKTDVELCIPVEELAYYNVLLRRYVVEPGEYHFLLAASSQDVRAEAVVSIRGNAPYSIVVRGTTMVG